MAADATGPLVLVAGAVCRIGGGMIQGIRRATLDPVRVPSKQAAA